MSVQATSWVFAHSEAAGNERLVLLALANEMDSKGWGSATKAVLAREARVSEVTVWRCLDRLTERGDISESKDEEKAPGWWRGLPKNRRPRLFHLTALGVQTETPEESSGVALGSRWGRAGVAPGRDASLIPNPVPQETTARSETLDLPDPFIGEFDAWWLEYPRRVSKGSARSAYTARRRQGIPAAELRTAAQAYARARHGEDPKFTMHPSTFLGPGERWREWFEPPEPEERGTIPDGYRSEYDDLRNVR